MSENKKSVSVDEADLQVVLNAVLKLLDEHQVFYAHVKAFEQRLNQSEELLFERTGPLPSINNRLKHLEGYAEDRISSLDSDLQALRVSVAELGERIRLVSERKSPFDVTLPATPELSAAIKNLKRYADAE